MPMVSSPTIANIWNPMAFTAAMAGTRFDNSAE
jgi:hypothetical protein